jgi:hypothetical protein
MYQYRRSVPVKWRLPKRGGVKFVMRPFRFGAITMANSYIGLVSKLQ